MHARERYKSIKKNEETLYASKWDSSTFVSGKNKITE